MKRRKRKKGQILFFTVLLGSLLLAVMMRQSPLIQARTEENSAAVEISEMEPSPEQSAMAEPVTEMPTAENFVQEARLDPVEHESGLQATPKVLVLAQNEAFPNLNTEAGRNRIFSELVIPQPQYGASYTYVNEAGMPVTPDSSEAGFQLIYVEITEQYSLTSIQVAVPVTITGTGTSFLLDGRVALQVKDTNGKVILYPDEIKDKTAEQLYDLIKSRSEAKAWDTETGEEVSVAVVATTVDTTSVGTYKVDFEVSTGSDEEQEQAILQKDIVVFGGNPQAYVAVAQNGTLNLSTNPTNLFAKFQTVNSTTSTNATYQFVDEEGAALTRFDTSVAGFHWAYVKMTDKTYSGITTVVKVPVNVTNSETTALLSSAVMVQADTRVILYPDETRGKSVEELVALTQSKANLKAWNTRTGELVSAAFTATTVNNATVGSYLGTITVELNGSQATTTRAVTVFGADPRAYVTVNQNTTLSLGTNPTNLFSKFQTSTSSTSTNATYQFVDEEGEALTRFDTSEVGFHWAYVKMTDKINTAVTTTIKVPINVMSSGLTTALLSNTVMVQATANIILYPDETRGKSVDELVALTQSKANLKAWDMSTGEPVSAAFTATTVNNTTVGAYLGTITVSSNGNQATTTRTVTVFGADPQTYVIVNQNGILALGTNPTNLFSKFRASTSATATNATYQFVDENGDALTKFDTSEIGFHWAYVKMTDKINTAVATTIRVPVNVMSSGVTTALLSNTVMVQANEKIILYPDETRGKNTEELLALIESKADLKAWNMSTGEPVSAAFTATTVNNATVGSYSGTITAALNGSQATTTRKVIVFGADVHEYVTIEQNDPLSLGTNPTNLFTKFQTLSTNPISTSATYQFVDEDGEPVSNFDTSEFGFHWTYVKMTDKTDGAISTILRIPVTVTAEHRTTLISNKVGVGHNLLLLTANEIKGKTVPQILSLLNEQLNLSAWSLTSGEGLEVRIAESTITQTSRGNKEITLAITMGEETVTGSLTITVLPETAMGDTEGWEIVPANAVDGFITNPINGSKLGFPRRGLTDSLGNDIGFRIVDKENRGYVYNGGTGRVSDIPGIGSSPAYGSWSRTYGLGNTGAESKITTKYFLRKGDILKEILVDQPNQVIYVYDLSLSRNLNFSVKLDMYNVSDAARNFSMLESVDTDYHTDHVPIYSLGNNSGFYMRPSNGLRFTIKLKDGQENWLSDYQKYIVGGFTSIGVSGGTNYFGSTFSGKGFETMNYAADRLLLSGTDSAYQLGAPWKSIAPDQALKTGYEVFAGDEIPYMELTAVPEVFNVYQDYAGEFKTSYKLSQIPSVGDIGTIYVTYPNGEESEIPFVGNSSKEFFGQLDIPRNTLPEQLNEEAGTIKEYNTSLLAINETEGPTNGLPSEETAVHINVYHLGATPIAQTIRKDSVWNKTAASLVQDPVILPGHTASYEYVNAGSPVDTSIVGLQYTEVRMIDTDEPERVTIIKVPVMIVDGTPPTNGLLLEAKEFSIRAEEVAELSEAEIHALILEKSDAVAWDIATGLSEGVTISVRSTTLTDQVEAGQIYTATIQADKEGQATVIKTIDVTVIPNSQKVHVTFVDESGDPLHEPITLEGLIGATIDLTEEDEVQAAIAGILAEKYQLTQKPEDETAVPVQAAESTVTYHFKGTLQIQSSPNFLNFGRKSLGIPFIKIEHVTYDAPLIIWDNRKVSTPWTLTATVKKPLTSQEDALKTLPRALRYQVSADEQVTLYDGETIPVATRNTGGAATYDVSQEWQSNDVGPRVEVAAGEVLQDGGYRATILWQVTAVP